MTSAALTIYCCSLGLALSGSRERGHFDETESNASRKGRKTTQAAI